MNFTQIIAAFIFAATTSAHAATVEVAPFFQGTFRVEEVVKPSQLKFIAIGPLKVGDQISIQIDTSNKVYNDITACLLTEAEARVYSPRSPCRGQIKARTPIVIRDQISADAIYHIVLDNTYAVLIKKLVSVTVTTRHGLSEEELTSLKMGFQNVQTMMTYTFESSNFDIFIKPCGQSNAFSNNQTADITLCTEFIHDMFRQRNRGALLAALLHEYGHSLLNRWGEPGSSEEDMADQFATAMLLRAGDNGRQFLQQWISYWIAQDLKAEAQNQLQRSDTHTLSI